MAIYFVEIGKGSGRIKIGHSVNPLQRIIGLVSQFQDRATLLAVMPGNMNVETALHEKFEHCRVLMYNELFHRTQDLDKFMAPFRLRVPIIAQRTSAGIQTWKERGGGEWGPKRIMTEAKIERAGKLLNGGKSGPWVAAKFNVSTASIYAFWRYDRKREVWIRKKPTDRAG